MLAEHFKCNTLPKWKPKQALKTASNVRKYWNSLKNTSNSDNFANTKYLQIMGYEFWYCIALHCIVLYYEALIMKADIYRYSIDIPRELSEIRTQPWLSEGSLTCDPCHHRGPIF